RTAVVGCFRDVDRLQRSCRNRRRETVGEQIGSRALAQQVDDRLRSRHETAHRAAEALAERTGDDPDAVAHAGQRWRATAFLTEMAGGMAIVDQDDSAMA